MSCKNVSLRAGRQLPKTSGVVFAARGEQLAIGADGNGGQLTAVTDSDRGFARRHLPEAHTFVHARRRDEPAVAVEGDRADPILVAAKTVNLLARRQVPEFHEVIAAAAG